MSLQELFNMVARSSKASPVFVKPGKTTDFLDLAAQQSSKASPVFVKPEKTTGFFDLAARQPLAASSVFKWPGQSTNYTLPAPGAPTPISTGLDEDGNVDRTKSDLYKQYALNAPGQFERYFKTPEMDQYFGAASRGAVAPKDVQAMQALAGKTVAPGKTPEELSAFYRAESAMGRAQMPQIQESLGYAKGSELAKWAEANPMLAQRLYAKKQARAEAVKQAAVAQTTPGSQYGGGVAPGAFGTTAPTIGSEDFAVAANAVPAPWNTQGAKVSADFAGVMPFQAAKTTGEGMPALQTTLDKAEDFLARTKAGSSFADPNMAKTWGAWGRILN